MHVNAHASIRMCRSAGVSPALFNSSRRDAGATIPRERSLSLAAAKLRKLDEQCELKRKFHGELHQSRRRCLYDFAEQGAGNIAIDSLRSEELRVIKNVEGFKP